MNKTLADVDEERKLIEHPSGRKLGSSKRVKKTASKEDVVHEKEEKNTRVELGDPTHGGMESKGEER